MKYTTNYNLRKPDLEDNVNIEDINFNTDAIDTELDKIGILNTKVSPQTPLNTTSQNLSGAINELKTEIATASSKAGKIGTKEVDETDIADNYTLRYDGVKNKIVYVKSEIDREPPAKVTDISVKEDNTKLIVNYTPPLDADYMGTRLVYNTTADPTNITDGTVIANYVSGTEITGLLNDTKYYIRLFPYDISGNYNTETGQSIMGTPTEMKIYGVKIDTLNSNPKTAVTYIDNAVGFTEAFCNNGSWQMGSWADKFPFNAIKPCLLKNGVVNYYLNPNDYSKKADVITASDITTGTDGDVMIEFPKIFWKFERIGADIFIRYSEKQVDASYKCLAHTVGVTAKDKIYISAYRGFSTGGKLRSLSGKTPTGTQTIGQFRTLAQANGAGYQQMCYYPLLMLQVLAIIMGKNRDSQTQLGRGFVDGNTAVTSTGGTNAKGMFYGENTGKLQNKFCGIEDFYGNQYLFIDGIYSDASWNMMISNQSVFNNTGAGYVNQGKGATANLGGWIGDIQGTTETGFIIKATNGSATTHYSVYGYLYGGSLPIFGGNWNGSDNAGVFHLNVIAAVSNSYANYGGSLCFIGV